MGQELRQQRANSARQILLRWSERLPNTELEEEKKVQGRKKKQTLGEGPGQLTTEDKVMGQILSIHLYEGWLPIQQIKSSTMPFFELFLARGPMVFVLQCVSSCLLLCSDISA